MPNTVNATGNQALFCAVAVPTESQGHTGHIYFLTDGECIKVGYSNKPVARRANLQSGNHRDLRLLATIPGTMAIEKALHEKLRHLEVRREWFRDRDYEIIRLIEKLTAAANPSGPMSLLPFADDIQFEHGELSLYMQHESATKAGTFEHRQKIVRHRIYTDLIAQGGGSTRSRDYARNKLKEVESGKYPGLRRAG